MVADWKGSEHPEQVVIVSGHLDSWDLATGAIDDGAGIAVAMQTIHLMRELNLHAKRSIRFVAWMDEEQGSYGAQSYAKEHAADLKDHIAALESDLGAGHPTGVIFTGPVTVGAWLRPIGQVLQPIGAGIVRHEEEAGEDISFLKGVPGLSPIQDSRTYFNYHHTAADTFDKIVPKQLNENAAVMSVAAFAIADAGENLPR